MINNIEKFIFNIIIWSFAILVLSYIVFLGTMVKNIVERKSLEANARVLESEVRDLELSYLSMSNNIDLNLSYSMGFKEVQATFATRKALGLGSSSGSLKVAQNDL
jgi:hypothetical protein